MMHNTKQEEFMKAYESCHERFIRYCSSLAFGKMDVQDLVQDVLLSAYSKYDQIKNKDELLHYLIRAARNRSISIWRKRKDLVDLKELHRQKLADQGVSPETILDIQLLYSMLNKLPQKQKEAIVLFEINGFSMKEIAVIQNSSEGATKTRISRGRNKLSELFSENPDLNLKEVFVTLKSVML